MHRRRMLCIEMILPVSLAHGNLNLAYNRLQEVSYVPSRLCPFGRFKRHQSRGGWRPFFLVSTLLFRLLQRPRSDPPDRAPKTPDQTDFAQKSRHSKFCLPHILVRPVLSQYPAQMRQPAGRISKPPHM